MTVSYGRVRWLFVILAFARRDSSGDADPVDPGGPPPPPSGDPATGTWIDADELAALPQSVDR